MDSRFASGLAGSLVLIVGVFAPIVQVPIAGSQNYFQNGQGDGVIVLLIGGVSLLLTFGRYFRALAATGLIALLIVGFAFFSLQTRIADMKSQMDAQLAGNPFRGLGDAMMANVQLQWGWGLLVVGAILLLIAGSGAAANHVAADSAA
jgi:hypothetical protein